MSVVLDYRTQYILRFEVLGGYFAMDLATEHSEEICGAKADEVAMVCDEDLGKEPVLTEQRTTNS